MASNITVSALALTPGIGHIAANWSFSDPNANGLPYRKLAAVELHASASNDRTLASKVAEGRDGAMHMGIVEGATYYYWIKARDVEGSYGDWFPSGSTSGIQATVGFAAGGSHALVNGRLTVSAAGNQLTIAVKSLAGTDPSATNPVFVGFRDQTGTYVVRVITSALSLTLPVSGSSLGAIDSTPFRIWACAFDNGGTVALAVINCSKNSQVYPLPEYALRSTNDAGDSGGADNAGQFYADDIIVNKPFRIIAHLDWLTGLPVAGTWSAAPDIVHLFGPGSKTPGDAVQKIVNVTNAKTTFSPATQIPIDTSVPQITEGEEFFSTTITPTSPINILNNEVSVNFSITGFATSYMVTALFLSPNASSIHVASAQTDNQVQPCDMWLRDLRQAGSALAQTFTVRCGGGLSVNDIHLNGGTGNVFGNALQSSHTITEIMG